MHDTLNRRKRYDGRRPLGSTVILQASDLHVFKALQDHHMLPSSYLWEYVKGMRADKTQFIKRLRDLYHEGGYIDRPRRQRDSGRAKEQPLTYELTKKGEEILARSGLRNRYTAPLTNWASHKLMTATITASIELTCRRHGLRYITQEEILAHEKCVHKKMTLPVFQSELIPDQLFGIEYPDKRFRFFALEADRATEDMQRIQRKLDGYGDVYRNQTYKSAWGLPNLVVLIVTTNAPRLSTILKMANQKQYLATYQHYFAETWYVPPLMSELIEKPWATSLGEFYINRA